MITTTVITFPTSVSNMSRSGGPYIRKNDHGDDGDVQMKRDDDGVTAKATESALAEDYVTIDRAQDPPQTDQRQSPTMEDVNALPNLSKRPRDGNDEAEAGAEAKVQRIKRRRVGEVKPGLERLHEDVGPLYLLCRNRKGFASSLPSLSYSPSLLTNSTDCPFGVRGFISDINKCFLGNSSSASTARLQARPPFHVLTSGSRGHGGADGSGHGREAKDPQDVQGKDSSLWTRWPESRSEASRRSAGRFTGDGTMA